MQSVRVVEVLENDGSGLNLTAEVRDGILRHSKGRGKVLLAGTGEKALTLEAEIVRIADIVAYVNHDLDDAMRAGLFGEQDVPADIRRVLGAERTHRFRTLVRRRHPRRRTWTAAGTSRCRRRSTGRSSRSATSSTPASTRTRSCTTSS